MSYILALDRHDQLPAIVFDHDGASAGGAEGITQIFPRPMGRADPGGIWRRDRRRREALGRAHVRPAEIAASASPTSARRRSYGTAKRRAVHNAIVWQDRRTGLLRAAQAEGAGETIQAKTGLLSTPTFPASRVRWILDNVPDARVRRAAGVGTVDAWLVWKLTNHARHITDVSNASRTMLFTSTR